jgi:hypothetical protein
MCPAGMPVPAATCDGGTAAGGRRAGRRLQRDEPASSIRDDCAVSDDTPEEMTMTASTAPLTRWRTVRRTILAVAACSTALVLSALPVAAGEATPAPATSAQSAPAAPSAAPGMPGCKNDLTGTCCGTCQNQAASGNTAAEPDAGCPCQRAKRAAKNPS